MHRAWFTINLNQIGGVHRAWFTINLNQIGGVHSHLPQLHVYGMPGCDSMDTGTTRSNRGAVPLYFPKGGSQNKTLNVSCPVRISSHYGLAPRDYCASVRKKVWTYSRLVFRFPTGNGCWHNCW